MDLNVAGAYSINDYIEYQSIFDPQSPFALTAATFDGQQELYWTGNSDGRVTSYYGVQMSKYTSFRVQSENDCEIRMLHANNNDIYVLTADTLASYSRFGTKVFKHKEVSFKNLQCMFFNQQERFFLGGYSDLIYDFDIERLRVLRQLSIGDEQKDCIIIKSSAPSPQAPGGPTLLNSSASRNGVLCTGSTNGQILVRDPFSLKSIHKFHPHNGSLSDFDVNGNCLVSCGFSSTRTGNLSVDRFLMVYDLRMLRALNPVQLMIEPCFLYYLPMCSSVVAVATQSGCFQLCDTNLITPSPFYQAQVPPIGMATTFNMSKSCQAAAFGHSSGSVHLFTKGENILFNNEFIDTPFIDPPQFDGNIFIDVNDDSVSLSSLPVPITGEKNLVSDFPKSTITYDYRPTPTINPELLSNARIIHGIMSVPNRINLKRNQVYNEAYQNQLAEYAKNSKETSLALEEMLEPTPPPAPEGSSDQEPAPAPAEPEEPAAETAEVPPVNEQEANNPKQEDKKEETADPENRGDEDGPKVSNE